MAQLKFEYPPEYTWDQGNDIGTLLRWHVKVGDRFEKDQILAELGTNQVEMDILAPAAGVLTKILVSWESGLTPWVDSGGVIAEWEPA